MVTQGCPCGYRGDVRRPCSCDAGRVARYRARMSGPLLDRIDIHVEVPALSYRDLMRGPPGESSDAVRGRVLLAREVQSARFRTGSAGRSRQPRFGHERCNASMGPADLDRWMRVDAAGQALLGTAVESLGLSARPDHRPRLHRLAFHAIAHFFFPFRYATTASAITSEAERSLPSGEDL